MEVRTRIAPSPTGFPHIGTIYQALFNYAFAKKNGGRFIVRVEDTDRTRFVEGAEEAVYKALDWFGLVEDESPRKGGNFGPYKQSERLEIYQKYTQQLIDDGNAEFVFYSKDNAGLKKDYSNKEDSEVSAKNDISSNPPKSVVEMIEESDKFKDWVVRMKVPRDQKILVEDQIRGNIEFNTNEISSQVLLKSDGFPTYHLAVVVDDHLMEISHIVRAEEWLTSFPKHKLLFDFFKWEMPPVFHTATLRNPDKSKLSKRHGHTNVEWYIEAGFLPEAILNYLALLGWSHPEEKEIFELDEFTKLFELKDIRPAPPVFDLKKLEWMNGEYIRSMKIEDLKNRLLEFDQEIRNIPDFEKYIPLAQTRMKTFADFKLLTQNGENVVLDEKQKILAGKLLSDFSKINNWSSALISTATISAQKEVGANIKDTYTVLTGRPSGLPFSEKLEIQGQSETISWLEELIKK